MDMNLPNSETSPALYAERREYLYAAGFPDAHTMAPCEVDEIYERLIDDSTPNAREDLQNSEAHVVR